MSTDLLGYTVPLEQSILKDKFCQHGIKDKLVIVLYRAGLHGWRVPLDMRHVYLPHQVYKYSLDALVSETNPYEIVVVGITTGTWVTVWARDETQLQYPK